MATRLKGFRSPFPKAPHEGDSTPEGMLAGIVEMEGIMDILDEIEMMVGMTICRCKKMPVGRKIILEYVRDQLRKYATLLDMEIASMPKSDTDDLTLGDMLDPQRYA